MNRPYNKKKDQPPSTSVIARADRPVAIRISPAGPGGALRRRGYGLPRPCGLAMTVIIDGWSFCFNWLVIVPGRREQCPALQG